MKKTEKKTEEETETSSEEEEKKTDTEPTGSEEETKEETEVESEEKEDSDIEIDYKAEAEKERKAREKAEKVAAENAFKLREEKRKRKEEETGFIEEDEDEKPVTRKELDAILDKDRKEQTLSKAKEIASNISGSEDEAELIMEVYKSRTFPTHLTLDQKLREAYLIANASKIIGQNAELKRALKGKSLSSKDGSGTHQDPPKTSEPNISNVDKVALQQVGFNWSGANRRWEKKLRNGKILVREKDKSGKWITRPLST